MTKFCGFLKGTQPPPIYDARIDGGCAGNGTTDDTAALGGSMAAAVAAGRQLYAPAGTYKTTGLVTVPSGLEMYGAGPTSIIHSDVEDMFYLTGTTGVSLRNMAFKSSSYTNGVSGLIGNHVTNLKLKGILLDNLVYGLHMNLSAKPYAVSTGWDVQDIIATNCRTAFYTIFLHSSTLARLNLTGVGTNALDHCWYMDQGCHNLTCNDITLTRGAGYCLQMHSSYTSGDDDYSDHIVFNNLVTDVGSGGRWPVFIGDGVGVGFDSVTINGWSSPTTVPSGTHLTLGKCSNVLVESFAVADSDGVIYSYGSSDYITLLNGTYHCASIPATPSGVTHFTVTNVTKV